MQLSAIDVDSLLPRVGDGLPTTSMAQSTHHAEAAVVIVEAAAVDDNVQ
jgi:hypothetical protein